MEKKLKIFDLGFKGRLSPLCESHSFLLRKRLLLLFWALLSITDVTCAQNVLKGDVNEDGIVNISDVTTLVDIILNGSQNTLPLVLSNNEVEMVASENASVTITSGNGNYEVSSSNTEVAGASLQDTVIKIDGCSAGNAVVTVRDLASNNTADIMVTVHRAQIVSTNNVTIYMGGSSTFRILTGNGQYEISRTNPKVIDIEPLGGSYRIKGKAVGTSVITVKNFTIKDSAQINVTVLCPAKKVYLGLPSDNFWADCNIGATSPEGYGEYYAWGETEEKNLYDWSTYAYCDGSYSTCYDLGGHIWQTSYDVAREKWGDGWYMPDASDFEELFNYCTQTITTLNGVKGVRFTGPNGNSIFMPFTGYKLGTECTNAGKVGYAQTGRPYPNRVDEAYRFEYYDSGTTRTTPAQRLYGLPVRPIW